MNCQIKPPVRNLIHNNGASTTPRPELRKDTELVMLKWSGETLHVDGLCPRLHLAYYDK
jgi:hypothetical protein